MSTKGFNQSVPYNCAPPFSLFLSGGTIISFFDLNKTGELLRTSKSKLIQPYGTY